MVSKKKNLLIISPTLPNPKMSAGDYRVHILTKELINLNYIDSDDISSFYYDNLFLLVLYY